VSRTFSNVAFILGNVRKLITDREESLEIPASTLAFSVNLNFEGVDFAALPPKLQERLKVLNNYSVQQLLIDFTSILAKLDQSTSTIYNHIEDLTARASFNLFIQQYFDELGKPEKRKEYVLHYIPLTNKESMKNYEIPTVPPTDFTFQNLPFIRNGQDNGGSSEDNMLVYLQMCGNPMPKQPLPVSANWVVPTPNNTDRYDGTVALSAKIFLDGWLVKQLSDFNKNSTWIVTEASWTRAGPFGADYKLDGKLGRTDASESDVKWNAIDPSQVLQNVRNKVNGQTGQWYGYYHHSLIDSPDNKGIWHVWQKGTTTNWLFIPEGYNANGKCEILLFGDTFVEFYARAGLSPYAGGVNGEWSTRIVLDGVNDGELIIKTDDIIPKITRTGEAHAVTKIAEDGLSKLRMDSIINDMRSVFKNRWDFVLPGAADFYISKAAFNREKDLLCELKYKLKA
jgi:hypothetical protein